MVGSEPALMANFRGQGWGKTRERTGMGKKKRDERNRGRGHIGERIGWYMVTVLGNEVVMR